MAEQPVNLSTVLYLGVFSRAEQRVLHAIFKGIAEGSGRCVATLARLARDSNTSKSTTRNAVTQAVAIGLLKKTERRSGYAVSLPNILTYGEALSSACDLMTLQKDHRLTSRTEDERASAGSGGVGSGCTNVQRPRALDQAGYAAVWEPKAPPGGTGLGGLRP